MEFPEHTITAFLDGELAEAEREAFLAAMERQPDLAEAVAQQQQLRMLLSGYQDELPLRKEIGDIYSETGNQVQARTRRFTRPWFFALAAAVVAILVWIIWPKQELQSYSPGELFAETFVPAPAPEIMGSDPDASRQLLEAGHTAYGQQQYREAISAYVQVKNDSLFQNEASFFLAQAYLANKQYAEALEALESVSNRSQEVRWFRALANLALGDTAATRDLLQPLASNSSYDYHQEAVKLLGQLRQVRLE